MRIGSGANCSSVGSVVDTLFATAAVGAAVFAGVLAALGREPVRGRRAGDHVGGREPVRGPRAGDDVGGRERETEGAPLEGHPALERATPGGARARGERASGAAPPDPDEGDR